MGVLTEGAFLSMVCLNQLKDCPITHDDIKNAHAIFDPDLANIRGKTLWRSPERVKMDYVEMLRELNTMRHYKYTFYRIMSAILMVLF